MLVNFVKWGFFWKFLKFVMYLSLVKLERMIFFFIFFVFIFFFIDFGNVFDCIIYKLDLSIWGLCFFIVILKYGYWFFFNWLSFEIYSCFWGSIECNFLKVEKLFFLKIIFVFKCFRRCNFESLIIVLNRDIL